MKFISYALLLSEPVVKVSQAGEHLRKDAVSMIQSTDMVGK